MSHFDKMNHVKKIELHYDVYIQVLRKSNLRFSIIFSCLQIFSVFTGMCYSVVTLLTDSLFLLSPGVEVTGIQADSATYSDGVSEVT